MWWNIVESVFKGDRLINLEEEILRQHTIQLLANILMAAVGSWIKTNERFEKNVVFHIKEIKVVTYGNVAD
jgi:hypothetical protein